jgi:DNA-binding transcriptional regulator YbjK
MDKGIFGDREKALEDQYMRQQEAKLLEKLRQNASLDELAVALAEKLQVDNPELLARARNAGVTLETATVFFLAPLVQVAWAEGSVGRPEHDAVLRLAQERAVDAGSPGYAQLEAWLANRPADALFDAALEVIKAGFAPLSHAEREERIERVVAACHEVAAASASKVGRYLGISDGVSTAESTIIEAISNRLRGRD